jgi:hypothetical protein
MKGKATKKASTKGSKSAGAAWAADEAKEHGAKVGAFVKKIAKKGK